ncbi:MAG: hypothetical protein MUF28_01370 [Ignavibacterium sp.]|jgi:hypothetical protein|nr:hypothetical protein [Ignavibacterium sp.]
MENIYHKFHIPVMGTGHSIDSPIRVAHLGIASVMSIVDDILIEKISKYYAQKYSINIEEIAKNDPYARSKRITAYLNLVDKIVALKLDEIKQLPFAKGNEKTKYFELLPDESPLKEKYNYFLTIKDQAEKEKEAKELTTLMRAGSIDVNIMSKLDRLNYAKDGSILSDEFTDAKAALRGYAESTLTSSIVFSAGFNRSLLGYLTQFKDFYRGENGVIKKKIIIKVSDFRSAMIQGKFLATKGLEVSEFRIESGLNCGGHAFASQGYLLPSILKEFRDKRSTLAQEFIPLIKAYYEKQNWNFIESDFNCEPLLTVQGGIGTSGEAQRMIEYFGCDSTGWGSPFLLVPEATCVDDDTLNLLMNARKEDLYLSGASPLGVPFNNLRNTGSENWTKNRAENGIPGSACPKGFLISDKQYTDKPICTASRQFQKNKFEEITALKISNSEKDELLDSMFAKVCLCDHLANGALIKLGISPKTKSPQSICPGPNIVWFNRQYSLKEMTDHIYGRGESLVSAERPHMFCQEIELYVNYFEKLIGTMGSTEAEIKYLEIFKENLEKGIEYILEISEGNAYPNENLKSIPEFVNVQHQRLKSIYAKRNQISIAVNF